MVVLGAGLETGDLVEKTQIGQPKFSFSGEPSRTRTQALVLYVPNVLSKAGCLNCQLIKVMFSCLTVRACFGDWQGS